MVSVNYSVVVACGSYGTTPVSSEPSVICFSDVCVSLTIYVRLFIKYRPLPFRYNAGQRGGPLCSCLLGA
eukprot:11240264-Heterocapsa_arctica.AAC.1